LEHIVKDILI